MRFLRRYKFPLSFMALLVFCSAMVVRQLNANQAKHAELREAFILLHIKGYTKEAQHLYTRLVRDLETLPTKNLLDDFQRMSMLVDPAKPQIENLLWKYYASVNNELEQRADGALKRALKLSDEE